MSDYLLLDKTEAAFVSVLTAAVTAANPDCAVVAGGSAEDKALPLVICAADGEVEEEPHGTGNFYVRHTTTLKTKATKDDSDTPDVDRQTLITAIQNVLMTSGLETSLSDAAADYTVFPGSIQVFAPVRSQEGDVWVDEFPMRVYCCASDLS